MILLVILVSLACGSESPAAEADSTTADDTAISGDTNDFGFEISMTAKPDSIFTIDDVKSTGWKSSKELPADLLEGASAVWFGFYQQKNLEVWIYDSHEDANTLGSTPASEIVAASRGVSGGAAGPYMKQTTHYGAYGVVGNLIILCETELTICEDLAAALP